MSNYRVFVEKYPEFQVEARSLLSELNENLQLDQHIYRQGLGCFVKRKAYRINRHSQ